MFFFWTQCMRLDPTAMLHLPTLPNFWPRYGLLQCCSLRCHSGTIQTNPVFHIRCRHRTAKTRSRRRGQDGAYHVRFRASRSTNYITPRTTTARRPSHRHRRNGVDVGHSIGRCYKPQQRGVMIENCWREKASWYLTAAGVKDNPFKRCAATETSCVRQNGGRRAMQPPRSRTRSIDRSSARRHAPSHRSPV